MRKEVLFFIVLIISAVAIFPIVSAAINSSQETLLVDKAYSCLYSRANTSEKCFKLSADERAFALLSTGQCLNALQNISSNNSQCWPNGGCKLKTTALAVMALNHVGVDTSRAQAWLVAQKRATTEVSWFLEIESSEPTKCDIEYGEGTFTTSIGADKKFVDDAGMCLKKSADDYWLSIDPGCFADSFDVSCDKPFLTTLLFKKPDSSTIHVLPESSSAPAGGTTTEKVESFCLTEGNLCNYEGTLWASLALDSLGKDVSEYLPYMTSMQTITENERFMPEVFLYFLTSDTNYKNTILLNQKSKKWWLESGDKFYDTALALFPFQQDTFQEKTNSKDYLLSVQDPNGCWENNLKNTAFILTSIWPRDFIISPSGTSSSGSGGGSGGSTSNCEDNNYWCTTSSKCEGDILSEYTCTSPYRCCDVEPLEETCADLDGEICSSSESCVGGSDIYAASDLDYGESCCIEGGTCELSEEEETSECEDTGGICRSSGCDSGEEISSLSCVDQGDSCCFAKEEGGSLLWVWILIILIVLVLLGILFREKLRMLWFKISSGRNKQPQKPQQQPLFHHPEQMFRPRTYTVARPSPQIPTRTTISRPAPRAKSGAQKELDDVLRKLKEMGK